MKNTSSSSSMRIQSFSSELGIEIWLVEDYTVPVVSMEFAFDGGAAQTKPEKAGLASLMMGLLDEGAGKFSDVDFQEALEERAIELSFDANDDFLSGSLRCLSKDIEAAFSLFGTAISSPRFEQSAIDRAKSQSIASIRYHEFDPGTRVRQATRALVYEGHPYAPLIDGTIDTLNGIVREDFVDLHKRLFARETLKIAVVGAISPKKLIEQVDVAFANISEKATINQIPQYQMKNHGRIEVIELDIPQSTLSLAAPGLLRKDPDFMPAMVLNHILGGGSFTSRFWQEVREKRGLSYAVWSSLICKKHGGLFLAGTATSNDRVAESLQVMRDEISKLLEKSVEQEELNKAKSYLTGSYALGFDTSCKIANRLLGIRLEDLGIDYINKRNLEVETVDCEILRKVANRIFSSFNPLLVVAGKPIGIVK